jgi:hypothetical protein
MTDNNSAISDGSLPVDEYLQQENSQLADCPYTDDTTTDSPYVIDREPPEPSDQRVMNAGGRSYRAMTVLFQQEVLRKLTEWLLDCYECNDTRRYSKAEIADGADTTRQSVGNYLPVLCAYGLIEAEKTRKHTRYHIPEGSENALAQLHMMQQWWSEWVDHDEAQQAINSA